MLEAPIPRPRAPTDRDDNTGWSHERTLYHGDDRRLGYCRKNAGAFCVRQPTQSPEPVQKREAPQFWSSTPSIPPSSNHHCGPETSKGRLYLANKGNSWASTRSSGHSPATDGVGNCLIAGPISGTNAGACWSDPGPGYFGTIFSSSFLLMIFAVTLMSVWAGHRRIYMLSSGSCFYSSCTI